MDGRRNECCQKLIATDYLDKMQDIITGNHTGTRVHKTAPLAPMPGSC